MVETWRIVTALRHEPAALVLSRQALPTLDRTVFAPASGVARGAYVLAEADGGTPDVILLATGSEVHLALAARDELQADGVAARVVSMPCWELFDRQPQEYRDPVLPPSVRARVAVEQASTLGWDRYVGDGGAVDRHAHLRGLGPAEAAARRSSASPPTGWPRSPAIAWPRHAGIAGVRPIASRGRRRKEMKATETLHERGQSLWLDNITRACSTTARSSATSTPTR